MSNTNTLNDVLYNDQNIRNGSKVTTAIPAKPSNEFDYVLSFFEKIMKDKVAAASFTQAIYEVANETQSNVLAILETLNTDTDITLSESMAYYLNGIRSPTALLGVDNTIKPNYYASRNVLG